MASGNGKVDFGVIFDVDGTMVDNCGYHRNAWIEFGSRHGLEITPEYYNEHIHSRSNDKIIRTLYDKDMDIDAARKIAEEKEIIYRETFGPVMTEIPGLKKLLEQLHAAKVPISAASNSPKKNVDFVLDGLGVRDYFDFIIDRDQVKIGKPDPQLFLLAADGLGLNKDRCIVVEDSVSGFKAAENAGMAYIVVTAGADEDELKYATTAKGMYVDHSQVTVEGLRHIANTNSD